MRRIRPDVVLHLVDATHPAADAHAMAEVAAAVAPRVPLLTVRNKIDLTQEAAGLRDALTVALSARTGDGLDALRALLLRIAGWDAGAGDTVFLARERQLDALRRAQSHLADAFAEELRLAANALAEITGEFTADDLLGRIFSRFCIGK